MTTTFKNKVYAVLFSIMCLGTAMQDAEARGGFRSGGGRSSFSSFRSSPSRSFGRPSTFRSSPSFSSRRTVGGMTTTRTTTRVGTRMGGGFGAPAMYPGFGMGYGYTNGMMTGLILGNLMHPHGTSVYHGGGYHGSALLYPDGRVVNQQGYQVGTYTDGQFAAMDGGMVAQPAPAQPMPVVVKPNYTLEIISGVLSVILLMMFLLIIIL